MDEFSSVLNNLRKNEGRLHYQAAGWTNGICSNYSSKSPHPLINHVEDELKPMESMGVISPIQEPTDWCAGMITVLKKNRQVRIYIDLIGLSPSVKRELHPLPVVG